MELVNSYLSELRQHLPRDQRDDILTELRDNIVEEINDRAADRDAAPDIGDERAVLAKLGHPLKVAGGYKTQRYLIGPELFPAYVQTLRNTLLIGFLVVFALRVAGGFEVELALLVKGLFGQFVEIGLWITGIVSVIFVGLEATGERLSWFHDWSPDALTLNQSPVDVSATMSYLLFEGLFLLWWNSAYTLDWGLDERWWDAVQLAPIWHSLFWPINLIVAASLVLHGIVLLRGNWQRWSAGTEFLLCIGFLMVIGILLGAQSLVTIDQIQSGRVGYPSQEWLHRTLHVTLVVVAGLTVWDSILAYRRIR